MTQPPSNNNDSEPQLTPAKTQAAHHKGRVEAWLEASKVYTERRVFILVLLGFSAGLPFLLVFSTLSAWLTEAGVSRSTIGFFSWVGITYSIKVFWAPFIDQLQIPLLHRWLGSRRSWMLIAQLGIMAGLLGMSMTQPDGPAWSLLPADINGLTQLACFALLVAFSSATQDVAIDAYRIEVAEAERQGAMSAAYILGYRIALLVSGAGALAIAEFFPWSVTYMVMGSLMGVGILAVLISPNTPPKKVSFQEQLESDEVTKLPEMQWLTTLTIDTPRWVQKMAKQVMFAFFCPIIDFFRRERLWALYLLVLISVYRISDITMGVMANPFYLDMGFTKIELATITKLFGFFMTILGSFVAGLIVARLGLLKPLLMGAVLVASTNLLFATLAYQQSTSTTLLAVVISADNFSGGMANVAFIAFLSNLINRSYTATQYALFSSIMTLPGKVIGGYSGVVVDASGYPTFFIYTAILGGPAILLAWILVRYRKDLNGNKEMDSHEDGESASA